MSEQQSLAERAVFVLAELANFGENITNEMPERHALRQIKHLARIRFDAALTDVEGLFMLAQSIRDSHRSDK
jgi:hypothetical protein